MTAAVLFLSVLLAPDGKPSAANVLSPRVSFFASGQSMMRAVGDLCEAAKIGKPVFSDDIKDRPVTESLVNLPLGEALSRLVAPDGLRYDISYGNSPDKPYLRFSPDAALSTPRTLDAHGSFARTVRELLDPLGISLTSPPDQVIAKPKVYTNRPAREILDELVSQIGGLYHREGDRLIVTIPESPELRLTQYIVSELDLVDAKLSDTLNVLARFSETSFLIRTPILPAHKVTLRLRNQPFGQVLRQVLAVNGLAYRVEHSTIIIDRR